MAAGPPASRRPAQPKPNPWARNRAVRRGRQHGRAGACRTDRPAPGAGPRSPVTRNVAYPATGWAAGPQVHPAEPVGHPAAHAGAQQPGQSRGERYLAARAGPGQPAGQHGHPVLPEEFAVQAAEQAVGQERVIHPAVHHRVAGQAQPGARGPDPGQVLDLPECGQARPRHVHEHVAGPDRGQVARVRGSVRARPRPARPARPRPAGRRPAPRPRPGATAGARPPASSTAPLSCPAALMAGRSHAPPPRVTAVRRDIAMAPIVRRPRGPHTPVRTSTTAQASTTTAGQRNPAIPPNMTTAT